ncbi:hypothetical protein PO909_031801 [Leuciscus waleckii]
MGRQLSVGDEVRDRDIYGGEDATDWNDNRRKTYRDNQLDGNADVLFGVYKPVYPTLRENLQCFLFRPERDPIWWMIIIRKQYTKLTVQWTHRRDTGSARDVINVSGRREDLEIFCLEFSKQQEKINNNPVRNSIVDDHIEDLTTLIQDFELENIRLRQHLHYLRRPH